MFFVSLPENLSTRIYYFQRITFAISVKIDDSQKYLQILNLENTNSQKYMPTCKETTCLNSNLMIFPKGKRIRRPKEKNIRARASKTYFQVFSTGVPNIFLILKMIW